MRRTISVVLVLAACLGVPVRGEEIRLDYVRHTEEDRQQPHGQQSPALCLEKPDDARALPVARSRQPAYGFVKLADGRRLVMLDRTRPDDEMFTRVHFDANHNGDLTDDPILEGPARVSERRGRRHGYVQFPIVDASVRLNGTVLPFRFRFYVTGTRLHEVAGADLTQHGLDKHFHLGLEVACHYSGKLQLDGRTYRFALADRNGNGRFTDRCRIVEREFEAGMTSLHPDGDALYVTEADDMTPHDAQVLGSFLLLRDRLFTVRIDEAMRSMVLAPVTDNLAPLGLAREARHVLLEGESDGRGLVMVQPGTNAMVPKGAYRLVGYQVRCRDAAGDLWQAGAVATPRSPYVPAGAPNAVLRFGEPYAPVVRVLPSAIQRWQNGDDLDLELVVTGAGDERLVDITRLAGSQSKIVMSSREPVRPKEPSYRILKTDGEIVAQGDFEYG